MLRTLKIIKMNNFLLSLKLFSNDKVTLLSQLTLVNFKIKFYNLEFRKISQNESMLIIYYLYLLTILQLFFYILKAS
jgi:hypothetical protein